METVRSLFDSIGREELPSALSTKLLDAIKVKEGWEHVTTSEAADSRLNPPTKWQSFKKALGLLK